MTIKSATRQKRVVSFKLNKALAAIRELSQDELFGKYPDFEDADTLRQKAWKRKSI